MRVPSLSFSLSFFGVSALPPPQSYFDHFVSVAFDGLLLYKMDSSFQDVQLESPDFLKWLGKGMGNFLGRFLGGWGESSWGGGDGGGGGAAEARGGAISFAGALES
jgi:hypothetical protein